MSCETGNWQRKRPQKHQNSKAFKNNLHDSSGQTKKINNLTICNVCCKCKEKIEWKIKYKKYKPLTQLKTCTKCTRKAIQQAYNTICADCAKKLNICAKCGNAAAGIQQQEDDAAKLKNEAEFQDLLKNLSERKRRALLRYMEKMRNNGGIKKPDIEQKLSDLKANDSSDEDYSVLDEFVS